MPIARSMASNMACVIAAAATTAAAAAAAAAATAAASWVRRVRRHVIRVVADGRCGTRIFLAWYRDGHRPALTPVVVVGSPVDPRSVLHRTPATSSTDLLT